MDNNKPIVFKSPIFTGFDGEETLWAEWNKRIEARASLKGLTSICPFVVKNPYFDQELLVEAICELLSGAGIPISQEANEKEGSGCLYCNPLAAKAERIDFFIYTVFLWFGQEVNLERLPYSLEVFPDIPTWHAYKMGATYNLDEVVFDVGTLIGVFIDAFFSVNNLRQKETAK